MSLFAGEQPNLGIFSTQGVPTINVPQVAYGSLQGGAGIQLLVPVDGIALDDAVTNANPTSATALMTYAFPGGSLNQLDRLISLFAAGEITTGVGTTTTFAVTLNDGTNTRTVATWTTGALTTGQTGLPWEVDLSFTVSVGGTSGAVFGHGGLAIPLTAPTAAVSEYFDTNTASTSALNLTQRIVMSVTSLFGTGNASNSVTQDMMIIEVAN